jgi:hypothetical protein
VHGTFDTITYLLLQTDDCCFWDTFETPMMLTGKYGVLAKGELAPTRTGAASHSKSLIDRRKKLLLNSTIFIRSCYTGAKLASDSYLCTASE